MNGKNHPVLIVNDDTDDRETFEDAWKELGYPNPLIFFTNGRDVLDYLKSDKPSPFIILCDVTIPKMDGFELKERILEDDLMNYKSIPFIYWSDEVSNSQIEKAYDLGGNGFFIKGNTFEAIKKSLTDIMNYWSESKMPR